MTTIREFCGRELNGTALQAQTMTNVGEYVVSFEARPRYCPSHQRGALRGKVPRSGGWEASAVYEFKPEGGDTCKRCSPPSVSQLRCDPPSPSTRSALVGRAMMME